MNKREKKMNKSILGGRLTADPQIKTNQNGTKIASFFLAINRRPKKDNDNPGTDYPSIVAFGSKADFVEKYVRKGTKLLITAHVQTGSYTDKDGVKRYTTDFVADEIEFMESKKGNSGRDAQLDEMAETSGDGFMNIPDGLDEELPFV